MIGTSSYCSRYTRHGTDLSQSRANRNTKFDQHLALALEIRLSTRLLESLSRLVEACEKFNREHISSGYFECTGKAVGSLPISAIQKTIDELAGLKSDLGAIVGRCTERARMVRIYEYHTILFISLHDTDPMSGGQLELQCNRRIIETGHQGFSFIMLVRSLCAPVQ